MGGGEILSQDRAYGHNSWGFKHCREFPVFDNIADLLTSLELRNYFLTLAMGGSDRFCIFSVSKSYRLFFYYLLCLYFFAFLQ